MDRPFRAIASNDRARNLLSPPLRALVRHAPLGAVRRSVWYYACGRYLAWLPHHFTASTVFGMKMAGNTQELLQQYIYYFGIWEPDITNWIRGRLTRGDTFVDVGANVGYYSLLAASLVGGPGQVVAIEAAPATFHLLQRNLELNHLGNVRAVNLAVADREGSVRLFGGPPIHIGLASVVPEPGLDQPVEVQAAPLDEILHGDEIARARIVKIDIEGAEWAAVAGMRTLLETGRRDLEVVVELHGDLLAEQGKGFDDVLHPFLKAGFHAYALENEYEPWKYLDPTARPRAGRITGPIAWQTNIVLSREDAEAL